MLADLTMVSLDRLYYQPLNTDTVLTNLIHAGKGSDVDLVMVDGKIIVEDGSLKTVDGKKVLSKLAATANSLIQSC